MRQGFAVEATTSGNALAMMNNELREFHGVAKARTQPGGVQAAVNSLSRSEIPPKEVARLKTKLVGGGEWIADQAVDVGAPGFSLPRSRRGREDPARRWTS